MRLLTTLLTLSEAKKDDLTRLPQDLFKEVQKNIRKGAEDLQQKWANALELVHQAYEVAAVQRPSPDMKEAWEQYEENIAYAVKQLSDSRGMEDDWRMSSAMFHEAFEGNIQKWRITFGGKSYVTESNDIGRVIDDAIAQVRGLEDDLDVDIEETENGVELRVSRWGVKRNDRVTIERA